jgi:hypothetical protein
MSVRLAAVAGLLVLAGASSASAQQPLVGSITMQMTIHLPDTLAAKLPGATGPINVSVMAATDGKRFAVDVSLPAGGAMPMFAGMHVRAVYDPAIDTIHAALLMPDMGTGSAGGYKLDVPTSSFAGIKAMEDSMMGTLMDSAMKKMRDSVGTVAPPRAVGTTETVAGISCEDWQTVSMGDTVTMCVAAEPASFKEFRTRIMAATGMQKMVDRMMGLYGNGAKPFGGRDMVMVKMHDGKTGTTMALSQVSGATPDPAVFQIPANLMPAPFALPFKGSGGAGQ